MTPQQFEQALGVSGYRAAEILGVAESAYYAWRRGDRKLPLYIERSMMAHVRVHEQSTHPAPTCTTR